MSLSITVGKTAVPFTVWRRGPAATLTGRLIAIDTETELIVPGAVPAMVIASATDGERGFFIARQHVGAFIEDHPNAA